MDKEIGILIVICSYVLGVFVSDFFNRRVLHKLDKKYTYINEIFKGYLESIKEPSDEDIKPE